MKSTLICQECIIHWKTWVTWALCPQCEWKRVHACLCVSSLLFGHSLCVPSASLPPQPTSDSLTATWDGYIEQTPKQKKTVKLRFYLVNMMLLNVQNTAIYYHACYDVNVSKSKVHTFRFRLWQWHCNCVSTRAEHLQCNCNYLNYLNTEWYSDTFINWIYLLLTLY